MSDDITVRCHACDQQIGTATDRDDVFALRDEHSTETDDEDHQGDWWLTVENPRPV